MKTSRVMSVAVALLAGCGESKKYPPGKDTVEQFGDGSWQIGKTGGGPNDPRKIHLFHHDQPVSVVDDIRDWRQEGDWLYLLGADGVYVVVNYRTDELSRYRSPEVVAEPHRDQLRKLRFK